VNQAAVNATSNASFFDWALTDSTFPDIIPGFLCMLDWIFSDFLSFLVIANVMPIYFPFLFAYSIQQLLVCVVTEKKNKLKVCDTFFNSFLFFSSISILNLECE
jgi:hypothetical protein